MKAGLHHAGMSVEVYTCSNVEGVRPADLVILGRKPQMHAGILGEEGICDALEGKLLIVFLLGLILLLSIEEVVPGSARVVKAMSNAASKVLLRSRVLIWIDPRNHDHHSGGGRYSPGGEASGFLDILLDWPVDACGSSPSFYAPIIWAVADRGS
ncbi:unnamed protein product [Tuber aestivum]|uniref:Uncharacterized protein n=1 Tax=Tuber aestivum TaxID=59557 RepID=A0A292PTL5_9PEZI|nr:unnamed protein product [Tuber aestivum]